VILSCFADVGSFRTRLDPLVWVLGAYRAKRENAGAGDTHVEEVVLALVPMGRKCVVMVRLLGSLG
jgi:hypothetical protein